jgi:hypothetical protein
MSRPASTLALAALAALTLTACQDATAPRPAAASPPKPSLAYVSERSGTVGQVYARTPSVSCQSASELQLRSIAVKGLTVTGAPVTGTQGAWATVILYKYTSYGWRQVDQRTAVVQTTPGSYDYFRNAEFTLLGPGSYHVMTTVVWKNLYWDGYRAIGGKTVAYGSASDYYASGDVRVGAGFCTLY